ncbi:MAG: hypothetical protein M3O34_03870 [Chloroflexota bacterium]|nr:hypothetical protein [Chloroflexota bacterium]
MTQMTGSRFLAEALHGYGVGHVFFVPTILTPALAADALGAPQAVLRGHPPDQGDPRSA